MAIVQNVFLILIVAYAISAVSAYGIPKAISTPSPECVRKCENCPSTPSCPPGISLVTDECGCCKMCARQIDETCDEQKKCDPHKNLYCSYGDVDQHQGRCVVKPGRSCFSAGKTYINGESFSLGCKVTCTCIDGYLACVPRCPITITAQVSKNCLHPKLVTKPGKCCEEWVCTGNRLNNTTSNTHPRPSSFSAPRRIIQKAPRIRHHVFAAARRRSPITITVRAKDKCKVQTTEWSPCSKTCGWGVSERVVTDKSCKLRKQTRLCQLRPCKMDATSHLKKGKRCSRTVKSNRRVRYSFSGCHSKVYTPKYCGACTDGRCCAPKQTVTKAIKFTCDDGFRFKKRMMIIKSCECSRKCVGSDNHIFASYRRLGGDTWRE